MIRTIQLANGMNIKIIDLKDWELRNYIALRPEQRKVLVEEQKRQARK